MQSHNSKFKSDLKQRCYNFSLRIIALSDTLPNKRSSWVINDQLIRCATSIGANIIEARASTSRRSSRRAALSSGWQLKEIEEVVNFKKVVYEIALKSANETKYWLELLRDAKLAGERVWIPGRERACPVIRTIIFKIGQHESILGKLFNIKGRTAEILLGVNWIT